MTIGTGNRRRGRFGTGGNSKAPGEKRKRPENAGASVGAVAPPESCVKYQRCVCTLCRNSRPEKVARWDLEIMSLRGTSRRVLLLDADDQVPFDPWQMALFVVVPEVVSL